MHHPAPNRPRQDTANKHTQINLSGATYASFFSDHDIGVRGPVVSNGRSCTAAARGTGIATAATASLRGADHTRTGKGSVAAAEAEMTKNGWNMVIAVVGPGGNLVYLQKADLAANASVDIAQDKARTSALFRVPTKSYMDRLANGETFILRLTGVTPVAGAMPIVVGGKLIGAIGLSGGTSQQDHQVAQAGASAVK